MIEPANIRMTPTQCSQSRLDFLTKSISTATIVTTATNTDMTNEVQLLICINVSGKRPVVNDDGLRKYAK